MRKLREKEFYYYNHNYQKIKWRLYKYFKRVKKDVGRRTEDIFKDVRGSHDAIMAFLEMEYNSLHMKIIYKKPRKNGSKKRSKVGRKRKYWALVINPVEEFGNLHLSHILNELKEEEEILNSKNKLRIAELPDVTLFKKYCKNLKTVYVVKGRGRPIKIDASLIPAQYCES